MRGDVGLLDANVLIYSIDTTAPNHKSARELVNSARNPAVTLFVTSQILCEFYSIITNPRRVAAPVTAPDAVRIIEALLALPGLHVLPLPASTVTGWMDLLRRRPVRGADIYDLQIVATMRANGIHRIYTFNTADFAVFPELDVKTPHSSNP